MSYSYCRLGVLTVGAVCAVLTGVFSEPGNINTFHPALLIILPLTLGALWYWQRGRSDARGYGVSAVPSALAALLLPLSTVFGPIFPALVGLIALGCVKRDLLNISPGCPQIQASIDVAAEQSCKRGSRGQQVPTAPGPGSGKLSRRFGLETPWW